MHALIPQVATPSAQRLPALGVGDGMQVSWHASDEGRTAPSPGQAATRKLLHLRPQRQYKLSHLRPSTKKIISCQAVAGLKNALTSQVTTPLAQRLPAHGVGNGLQVTWHAFHPAHPHACFSTAGVTGRRGPGLQTQGTCGACQHRSSDTVLAGAAGSLIWLE